MGRKRRKRKEILSENVYTSFNGAICNEYGYFCTWIGNFRKETYDRVCTALYIQTQDNIDMHIAKCSGEIGRMCRIKAEEYTL